MLDQSAKTFFSFFVQYPETLIQYHVLTNERSRIFRQMSTSDYKGKPLTVEEGRESWNRKKTLMGLHIRPSYETLD
jgi:hypothetical protein